MLDPAVLLPLARTELARLPVVLDAMLEGVEPSVWRERPAPAEWSPLEIVCHLRDEETDDFGARVRVIVAGGDRFTRIDPERWVEDRQYRAVEPAAALATLRERRATSLAFLAAVSPERLRGSVAQSNGGVLSGLDLLAAWVTHDRLHLAQLCATLASVGARRLAPLRAEYAGPIPYRQGPLQ
jgi:hypothetical protein